MYTVTVICDIDFQIYKRQMVLILKIQSYTMF